MFARRICLSGAIALMTWLLGLASVHAQPVAFWSFDSDFSATVGGPTYDATPFNGASISNVQSKFGGGAAHFDKSLAQYATTTASPVGTSSFSYSFWYYLDVEETNATDNRQFSPFGTGGPGDAYTIHVNVDGSTVLGPGNDDDILVFHTLTALGVPEIVHSLPNPWDHRQWQNIIGTVTYDGTFTKLEAFWNGQSVGTAQALGSPFPSAFVAFGVDRYLADRLWNGWVDDVAVYDYVLSGEEIAALQVRSAGVPEPTTMALFAIGLLSLLTAPRNRK